MCITAWYMVIHRMLSDISLEVVCRTDLYLVFGIRLQSSHIVGGHIRVTGVEPERLAVVLVNTLLYEITHAL